MELTPKQLLALPPQDYLLIDMRNSADREYGTIPGSVACSAEQLLQEPPQTAQKLVIFCAHGVLSVEVAEQLCQKGLSAYSLQGGYLAWLRLTMRQQEQEDYCFKVEQSLRKKFKKDISYRKWRNFSC